MIVESERALVRSFGRHLVALCLAYRVEGARQPLFRAYSGTLLQIGSAAFYLTSGHGLREVFELLRDDRIKIAETVLADTFGEGRHDRPIPIALDPKMAYFIDDGDAGLDFGLLYLDQYYVRLLAANSVVALSEKNWIHQHKIEFDAYMMLGLPDESSSEHIDSSGKAFVEPVLINVYPVSSNELDSNKSPHWFVGRVAKDLPFQSLSGMSGGPILGFSIKEQVRYWVVALQSRWNKDSRLVYGCSVPLLAEQISRAIKNTEPK